MSISSQSPSPHHTCSELVHHPSALSLPLSVFRANLSKRWENNSSRIVVIQFSERKIDLLGERLASIEQLLRGLSPTFAPSSTPPVASQNAAAPSRQGFIATPSVSASASAADETSSVPGHSGQQDDDAVSESALVGDSSLAAHTAFASEFIEVTERGTQFHDGVNPSVLAALSSLRQIVALQKQQMTSQDTFTFPRRRAVPPGGLSQLPMPPASVVVARLKLLKDASPSFMFRYFCSLLGDEDFGDLCRKVYFCTDEYSYPTFITVNTGLYYMFVEQCYLETNPATKEEVRGYCAMCQTNLETALANLPLFLPAKTESIKALLLGALYAIDVSKPSIGWQLTCKAAEICQTLGFHRASATATTFDGPRPDRDGAGGRDQREATNKDRTLHRLLFWHTYMLDSSFALRLGRASAIREFDITIDMSIDQGMLPAPWGQIAVLWIRHARIQNRMYKLLYSPAALARPASEQELCARGIAKELADLSLEAESVRSQAVADAEATEMGGAASDCGIGTIGHIHLRGDEVVFYSTLTLAYRAIPPPEGSPSRFCHECIETARHTMLVHQRCMAMIDSGEYLKVVYVHWALMLTPFVPFFVLICHVIDTSELSDLQRLDDFVETLLPVCPYSESVQKLHRLCQVMCSIARFYVEAKAQQHDNQNFGPIGDEFEMYLGELGFMAVDPPQDEQQHAPAPVAALDDTGRLQQSSQLLDWFSGNRNMMGLLEEELPDFGQTEWDSGV